ncbi:MAG: 3-dehydroquinate synthase [Pseudomonadales bacterium]
MRSLNVELDTRSYPIHIGDHLLERLGELMGPLAGQQIALVSNPVVSGLYRERVLAALPGFKVDCFDMPDGEAHKTLAVYADLLDFLLDRRHNRSTCLIALGGGVVGDLTGFAAATFQRGVSFVQVPTTLLAQVDSSVGGKTAVNHPAGKNMIGAFYQPQSVIISTDVLHTLPAREYAAGLAEVVKYGMIADAELFDFIAGHVAQINQLDNDVLMHLIERSCAIKAQVVAEDERESGMRAILNFGHTFAHAIEKNAGYGTLLHGEAVAIGMLMAARFSARLGLLAEDVPPRLQALLSALKLPTQLPASCRADALLDAMGMDKKAVDGQIRFVLAEEIGKVIVTADYDHEALTATLDEFVSAAS